MGAPYIYDISRLRVKDLHSATYIYVVRRLRVNPSGLTEYQEYLLGDKDGRCVRADKLNHLHVPTV